MENTEHAPHTIDIFSAKPGDIVIYENYLCSESLRDEHYVGIYQGFEYWTPDERPLELWVQMEGCYKSDLGMKISVRASQIVHIYKGSYRER